MRTTLVVPCFNEGERLDIDAFSSFAKVDPELSVIFVDDGSTDATRRVLDQLCERQPGHFEVISLGMNHGKAEAVRRGVCLALARGDGAVGYLDADLATPLSAVGELRSLLGDSRLDIVMGSRVALLGRRIRRTAHRHYLGRFFATCASAALGLAVYDTQCGAKLFRNTAVARGVFGEEFRSRWAFDVEVLARYRRASEEGRLPPLEECARELPLERWSDVAGSKLSLWSSLRTFGDLARIWFAYRPRRVGHPRRACAERL